jgi:hypothetical protein
MSAGLGRADVVFEEKFPGAEVVSRLRETSAEATRRRWWGARRSPSAMSDERDWVPGRAVTFLPDEATVLRASSSGTSPVRAEVSLCATKVVPIAPWSSTLLDTYAASLSAVSRRPDAPRLEICELLTTCPSGRGQVTLSPRRLASPSGAQLVKCLGDRAVMGEPLARATHLVPLHSAVVGRARPKVP